MPYFKIRGVAVELRPHLLPTAIGSMPHTDVQEACQFVLNNFRDIPVWPQLPNVSFLENMYVQYTEGMPGVVVDEEKEKVYFDLSSPDFQSHLQDFYEEYLAGDTDSFAISFEYAQGLYGMIDLLRSLRKQEFQFIKGQVTGPVSMGLAVTDQSRKPVLYNEEAIDAITKALAMKAKWQEEAFKKHFPDTETIIFFDEPYLSSFGTAYVSLSKEKAISLISEAAKSVQGMVGVHCCGNTDWSILAQSDIDIISFDAYGFADNLALYRDEIEKFVQKGRAIAWGVVPSSGEVKDESVGSLSKLFEEKIDLLAGDGLSKEELLGTSLITPSCGTGTLSVELSEMVVKLTNSLSKELRRKYT